jgi:tyrosyl-tRNA synthetase
LFYKAGDLKQVQLETLEQSIAKLDSKDVFRVERGEIGKHRDFVDLLHSTGIGKSKSDIRREVEKGGVYLNNVRLHPDRAGCPLSSLLADELLHNRHLVVRLGKKHYKVISLS